MPGTESSRVPPQVPENQLLISASMHAQVLDWEDEGFPQAVNLGWRFINTIVTDACPNSETIRY